MRPIPDTNESNLVQPTFLTNIWRGDAALGIEHNELEKDYEQKNPTQQTGPMIVARYFLEVVATNNPRDNKPLAPVVVPPGHGYYFARAINNGWTDNKNNGSNPSLEGWWFEQKGQYINKGARAQLVAKIDDNNHVGYYHVYNWGTGGTAIAVNQGGSTWSLHWYMNDNLDYYYDNRGTANIDVVVVRM